MPDKEKLSDKISSAAADVGDYLRSGTVHGTNFRRDPRGIIGVDPEEKVSYEKIGDAKDASNYGPGYWESYTPFDTHKGIDTEIANRRLKPDLKPPKGIGARIAQGTKK